MHTTLQFTDLDLSAAEQLESFVRDNCKHHLRVSHAPDTDAIVVQCTNNSPDALHYLSQVCDFVADNRS